MHAGELNSSQIRMASVTAHMSAAPGKGKQKHNGKDQEKKKKKTQGRTEHCTITTTFS